MAVSNFFARLRTFACHAVAATALLGANPALANSSATADIAAPLRAAQESRQTSLNEGDAQFRKLFTSWRSLEKAGAPALAIASRVAAPSFGGVSAISIPSRMPVPGFSTSSGFGMRTHPVLGGRRGHKGIDLAGPTGTPIHATADGMVGKAEWFGGYGLYVQLEHGGDIQTRYGHMSRLNVAPGQHVRKGDVIGFIGSTGRSTGPHLHYEVRIAGNAVNPVPYMQGDRQPATLIAVNGGQGGE